MRLNLKQFMIRGHVLKLYREFLRTAKQAPNEASRKEVRDWVRADFKTYKHETDEFKIRGLILYGERTLLQLQQNLELSGNKSTNQISTKPKSQD